MNRFDGISETLLAGGVAVRMQTRGMSMFPVVCTGDMVIVKAEERYAVGDVVVFKVNQTLVCHRLVKLFSQNGRRFGLTRGDARVVHDAPVPVEKIIGKMVDVERGRMSCARRMLMLLNPCVRHGSLNAFVVSLLMILRGANRPRA